MKKNIPKIAVKRKYLYLLAALVLIALAVVSIVFINMPMVSKLKKLPFVMESNYFYTGTGFLYVDGDRIKYIDLCGGENYSGKMPHADMKLAGYGANTHALYDSSMLSIIGISNAISVNGTVKSVCCGDGFIACLSQTEQGERVDVYNNTGRLVQSIEPEKNDIAFIGFTHLKKEQLYIVRISSSSQNTVSTITTYDPSSKAITGIITVYDQLIEQVMFTTKSVFVKGTENVIRYDTSNKERYRLLSHGLHADDCYAGEANAYMIMYSDTSEKTAKMYVMAQDDVASEQVVTISLPQNTKKLFAYNGDAYAVTNNAIYRIDKSGDVCETKKFNFEITFAQRLDNTRLLIADGSTLYITYIKPSNFLKDRFK